MAKRARRGSESRTAVLTVRLTMAERVRIEQRAAAAGLTVSAWAAQALNKGRVTVEPRPGVYTLPPELIAEFKRIGNNVNQIAHVLNAKGNVRQESLANAFRDFIEALLKDEVLMMRAAPAAQTYVKAAGQQP